MLARHLRSSSHSGWLLAALAPLLAACTDPEVILPGAREDIREEISTLVPEEANAEVAAFVAPAAVNNASWTHGHGSPAYRTDNPALGSNLNLLWTANIGQGDRKRARISADPVIADGRVFTLDSAGRLSATSTAGAPLWSRDLRPERDARNEVSGGGMALGGGRLYVTTGYGSAYAIDPASGDEIWEQRLLAAATAPPSYDKELVYLVAGDDVAWAIEADDGRVRWQLESLEEANNVFGGPAPAVTDEFVLFGFGNGDVQAAFKEGGLRLWSATVAGQRSGFAINRIGDITGDPIVVGNRVYVSNHSGRLVALSLGSGQRIWTGRDAAVQPVWVAGGSLFMVTDRQKVKRLDAETGTEVWSADLPGFVRNRPARREAVYAHHGPILAGGQLIVASSDEVMRVYDPESGALLRSVDIPGGASTNPVVVGGVLYLVSGKGQLLAFGG
ncbi:MAG: PQQ-like beta-propeller repeat protein [Marinovum sp.]|nr:PQQ-like beta-propeller repeat protein [Marinovum sp.]